MTQKEVVEIKKFSKGTKSINFYGLDHPDFIDYSIGYLIVDASNNPIKIVENESDTKLTRLQDNNFKYDDTIKFITGRTFVQTFNYEVSDAQKGIARQKFIEVNKTNYGENNIYWSDFSNVSIDDIYANVSFVKTYNTLNTLSVINSVVGETTYRESPTGVVFGKLESLQKISDENGNKIRIPLSNVPVCVFRVTDEFPDVSSVDAEGNRIVLNLKENSSKSQYFNDDAFNFAQDFLKSTETVKFIPDKYRYSALTNEKGEFVIYDVPVGTQTFMVEVDLLKQGLSKDEVALNFFPYPTTSEPNVDNIPHLYFRQFSINVVPSWSDFQSGYTQLNISIPLDLRKWATYIFPPVAFAENEKLEVTVSKNAARKFKIQVRDMTSKTAEGVLYPTKSTTLSKIQVDTDRDEGSQYIWFNEFAENRRQVEYTEFGCYALKLPANLYDPDGYKTNENGFPTQNKGVWLAAYQLKETIDEIVASRATGGYSYWRNGKYYLLSHFDINYTSGNDIERSYPVGENAIINQAKFGEFPYEKPWTINYPNKYSIPLKPVIQRFQNADDGVKRTKYDANHYFMDEPAYEDGDLLGIEVNGLAGGFGIQFIPDAAGDGPGVFFPNRISQVASKNFMYKYESGVAWNETYANGYEPYWSVPNSQNPFAGISKVVNGEKFQRVECGYGYFMKPQAWPRYVRASWGSDIPSGDILDPNDGSKTIARPKVSNGNQFIGEMYTRKSWNVDVYNIDEQNLALALSNQNNIKRGGIDIYRIVQSGVNNLNVPASFIIPTYARLICNFSQLAFSFSLRNDGEIPVKIRNRYRTPVFYYDLNDNVQVAQSWEIITLGVGKIMFLNGEGDYSNWEADNSLYASAIVLPGNGSFNTDLNQYTRATYNFRVTYKNTNANDPGSLEFEFSEGTNTSIPSWWVRTETSGGDHGIVHDGISRMAFGGQYTTNKNDIVKMFYEQYGEGLEENHGYYE